jgi:two-component system, cell cycle sensor histidine kinase and response regulator CckA
MHMPVFGIQPAGLLQRVFDNIGAGVAVIDSQQHVVFANRTALKLFGVTEAGHRRHLQEWKQKYRFEDPLGHEVLFDDSPVMRALRGEHVESQELRLSLPDGSTKWVNVGAYPFSVVGLAGVLTIILDETSEVQLRRSVSQLQRMETLSSLALGLTHDFNNILDTISLNAELARGAAAEGEDYHSPLEQISGATKKAADLVRRLMRFSRAQRPHPQILQINNVIGDVLQLLHPLFRQAISVRTDLYEALPRIEADRSQMEQVLINLIVNALDAMPSRGELTLSTMPGEPGKSQGSESNRGFITIVVSDTGPGIPMSLQSAIFEPFFTTKPAGKGTGLGLSTVHAIVEQHRGRIAVRSTPGAGAAFIISLPACELPAAAA